MISVLLRLQWMSLRGRVVRSIRLLRQPKYLVGFVVGAGWMGLWVLRPLLHGRIGVQTGPGFEGGEALAFAFHRIAAFVVTFLLPLPWLVPWGPLGLSFREAELTMLLQAPLTRRQLIQYGLLKSELGVAFGALVASMIHAGRGPFGWLLGFVATWLFFDFWHVNGRWRALFNLRQREVPTTLARRRRLLLTLALLGFYVVLLLALAPLIAQAADTVRGSDPRTVMASLAALEWPSLLLALCAPASWLIAPIFAERVGTFLVLGLPVVVALFAQREVVLRSRARFEEQALERARVRETRKTRTRRFARLSSRARSSHPFRLDPHGDPAVALVWKNAMRVSRLPWRKTAIGALLLLATIALLPALLRFHDATYWVLTVLGMVLTVAPPIGAGMLWNNDLRTELASLELLRTWPVSARRFVLAEIASPALLSFTVSAFGTGLVLVSVLGSSLREALTGEATRLVLLPRAGTFLGTAKAPAMVLLLASVLTLSAAVSVFSSALQNLATLFVPAWMAQGADRARGIAAFGQRMLSFTVLLLALASAFLPGLLLVVAVAFLQRAIGIPWSAWELPFWALLVAAPIGGGAWLLVEAAARLWERLDPSLEILEIGR